MFGTVTVEHHMNCWKTHKYVNTVSYFKCAATWSVGLILQHISQSQAINQKVYVSVCVFVHVCACVCECQREFCVAIVTVTNFTPGFLPSMHHSHSTALPLLLSIPVILSLSLFSSLSLPLAACLFLFVPFIPLTYCLFFISHRCLD